MLHRAEIPRIAAGVRFRRDRVSIRVAQAGVEARYHQETEVIRARLRAEARVQQLDRHGQVEAAPVHHRALLPGLHRANLAAHEVQKENNTEQRTTSFIGDALSMKMGSALFLILRLFDLGSGVIFFGFFAGSVTDAT